MSVEDVNGLEKQLQSCLIPRFIAEFSSFVEKRGMMAPPALQGLFGLLV